MTKRLIAALAALTCVSGCRTEQAGVRASPPAHSSPAAQAPGSDRFTVPIEFYRLPNGLKVVLSEDRSAPRVAVTVYYNIGFRIEPRNRTGFAHLFGHMMFQGSTNLKKMEFDQVVQANGGSANGSTSFDYTNYFQVVPSHALEPILWAEADRMAGLRLTDESLRNQQDVVKNEVRVNVLNQPYGGFPWLDLPQHANANWYNAHNFYGDFGDLESATLADVNDFFHKYYVPNNAVIVLVGDFDHAAAKRWIEQYFGKIPSGPVPAKPDVREPRQEQEKRAQRVDDRAERPALAVGYHAPARNTPEHLAMGLLHHVLLEGKDSLLYQALVQRKKLTGDVSGGLNIIGNMFDYDGPSLWTAYLFHDAETSSDAILAALDEVIEKVRSEPLDAAALTKARLKAKSTFFDIIERESGLGLADLLACFALFDDDPHRINRLEADFAKVTPELVQATAREYLRKSNRTVLTVVPKG